MEQKMLFPQAVIFVILLLNLSQKAYGNRGRYTNIICRGSPQHFNGTNCYSETNESGEKVFIITTNAIIEIPNSKVYMEVLKRNEDHYDTRLKTFGETCSLLDGTDQNSLFTDFYNWIQEKTVTNLTCPISGLIRLENIKEEFDLNPALLASGSYAVHVIFYGGKTVYFLLKIFFEMDDEDFLY